jgi:hypothetical protein
VIRLFALLVFVVTLSAAPPTLCMGDETVVYGCTAGKKIISVCASKDASAEHGYLQYRFGPVAKPELMIPADKSVPPAKSALAGNLVFSGGGGAYLRFKAGDYEYVVYTAIGRGWGTKDGVAVEQNGKRRGHVSCRDEPRSEMGPDYFGKLGLREDPTYFDLP